MMDEKMKMCVWSVVLCVFVVGLCFAAPEVANARETVVIGIRDNIASLDPHKSYEGSAWGIINYVYERLVNFHGNDFSTPAPELAESWELGDDGKTWTFHLRKDVHFAGGNPLKAEAVVFSLRRAIRLGYTPSWLLLQFGLTEDSISALDEYTVQIVLDQQYAPGVFLSCLTLPIAAILDPAVMEHEQEDDMGGAWLEAHSAGSGPYLLAERQPLPASEYVLKTRKSYWREKPLVQQIFVKGIPTADKKMFLLEQGELDIALEMGSAQILELAKNPNIHTFEALSMMIRYLTMNLGYEPLARSEVRDAIRYAINYDEMIELVLQGAALKVQTFIPKGLLGYNPNTPYSRELAKAKALMEEAGYADGFEVELKCLEISPWLEIASKIKADLSAIGIDVTINPRPNEQFMEEVWSAKRDFQFALSEWGTDYLDPDSNAKGFAHSDSLGEDASIQALAWWSRYINMESSKLVEQAMRELDSEKRQELYKTIMEIILDDGPFAILCTPIHQYAARAEIVEFLRPSPISTLPFPMLK